MRIFSTVLVLALAVTLAAAQGPGKKICSVNMLFRDRFNVLYCGAIACMHLYLYYGKQSCYSDSCMRIVNRCDKTENMHFNVPGQCCKSSLFHIKMRVLEKHFSKIL
jgi:hypothetical protein